MQRRMCCSNRRSQCKLFRKMWLTSREASRRCRTLHGIVAGPKMGRAGRYAPLPTEEAASIPCVAEECRAPSAQRLLRVPWHGHANMAALARRRCHCAGCLRPVPEPTAREAWLALSHVWMMHRVRVTLCARVLRACGRAVGIQAPACCSAFESSFGSCCPRAVREKRRGGAYADRIVAIVQASIAAMCVGVNVGVLYELVCVVADGVGVPGGHGGRV